MKSKTLTTAIMIFTLSGIMNISAYSQSKFASMKPEKAKQFIENLKVGLQSENEGLKKDCVFFAGKYKIPEAKETLIKLIKKEKNPYIRVLIALSLYQIDDQTGIEMVKDFSIFDNEQNVRRMCVVIFKENAESSSLSQILLTEGK